MVLASPVTPRASRVSDPPRPALKDGGGSVIEGVVGDGGIEGAIATDGFEEEALKSGELRKGIVVDQGVVGAIAADVDFDADAAGRPRADGADGVVFDGAVKDRA